MLTIRFSKIGRKGERKYRIVVKEKRDKRDGKAVDIIGFYEKKDKNNIIKQINKNRLNYWISHGAQISESVKKIL
jgi:small subunit ribosomal protein S16